MNNAPLNLSDLVRAVFYFLLILLGFYFLFIIRDILLIFFVAIVFALAFDTPIDWLQKCRLPRFLGTLIFYLFIFAVFGLFFYLISLPLGHELRRINEELPLLLDKIASFMPFIKQWWQDGQFNLQEAALRVSSGLALGGIKFFGSVVKIFGNVLSAILVLIIAVYLNAREKGVKKFLLIFVPAEHHIYALNLIDQIQRKMGGWLWGVLFSSAILGLFTYMGLAILGVPFALTLGLVSGFLNFFPYIGPIVAGLLAGLMALLESPALAVWVIALYLVLNLVLEDALIRPIVMKKAIGIDALLILFAVLVGAKLAGIIGIILAIPTAAIIGILAQEYLRIRTKETGIEVAE